MKIVIEISEEKYKQIVESKDPLAIYRCDVAKALENGKKLKPGYWCKSYGYEFWKCSECGGQVVSKNPSKDWHFCPNCGTEMENEK